MKNTFKFLFTSLVALGLGLTSCNDGGSSKQHINGNKYVTAVEFDTTYEECQIGDSFQITATISYRDDQEVEVEKEWRSSKKSVATVSDEGFVEVVGSGTTFITLRAGYQMASCKVYVPDSTDPTPDPDDPTPGPGPVDPDDPDAITITLSTYSRTLDIGGTFNLVATPSKAAEVTFEASSPIIEIQSPSVSTTSSACIIKALSAGEADVIARAGEYYSTCHVSVLSEQEQGDKEYTIYFYIDYNNVDPKDNTKLLAKFDWYYDRPLIEAKDAQGNSLIPTVTNSMAMDPAFPYFIGWSTHPIIDTKDNLWDLNKDTVADLPMMSYTVTLYGQWMDVPVLPAQEETRNETQKIFVCSSSCRHGPRVMQSNRLNRSEIR